MTVSLSTPWPWSLNPAVTIKTIHARIITPADIPAYVLLCEEMAILGTSRWVRFAEVWLDSINSIASSTSSGSLENSWYPYPSSLPAGDSLCHLFMSRPRPITHARWIVLHIRKAKINARTCHSFVSVAGSDVGILWRSRTTPEIVWKMMLPLYSSWWICQLEISYRCEQSTHTFMGTQRCRDVLCRNKLRHDDYQ